MIVYTTCRRCGGLLHSTDGDTVHPLCEPKPTKVERLAQEWLSAVEAGEEAREKELFPQIEALYTRPPRLLDAALAYANWGWPVFPLRRHRKAPAIPSAHKDDEPDAPKCRGECGREGHGLYDAVTNADTIRGWWERFPNANIGLRTGVVFDVIDFDVPEGIPTLCQLVDEDRAIHGWVITASGGTHLYIKPTGRGNHTRWLPGTDYRGQGGYVVAPPSWLGERGKSWTWQHQPSPIITGVGDTYGVQ